MDPADRFERSWRELRDEIKRREIELEGLKRKFKTLDDARLVLIQMTPEGEAAAERIAQAERNVPPRGLQEAALEYIRHSPHDEGATAAQVANALRQEFQPRYTNRNSYLASVFVTLKRLAKQNKVRAIITKTGRHYIAIDATRNLFMPIQVRESIIR